MTTSHLARALVALLAVALSGCASTTPAPDDPAAPIADPSGPAFDPWAAGDRLWVAMEVIRLGGFAVGDPQCTYGGLASHPIIRLSSVPPGTTHLEAYVASWELSSGVRAGYDFGDGDIQALPDVRLDALWFRIDIPHGAFETNESTWGFYAIQVLPGTTQDCYDGFALGDATVEFYAVRGADDCQHEDIDCAAASRGPSADPRAAAPDAMAAPPAASAAPPEATAVALAPTAAAPEARTAALGAAGAAVPESTAKTGQAPRGA